MRLILVLLSIIFICIALPKSVRSKSFQTDTIPTNNGNLEITFIGHASLMFKFDGKIFHVDPVSQEGDYSMLAKADLILVTHDHGDHLDAKAIEQILKPTTAILVSSSCVNRVARAIIMKNGDTREVQGVSVTAVPAYNIIHLRDGKNPFHPKGNGNGYVITFGNKNVYIAGDTENIPEMKQLTNINIAFLPMNLPYTMTPAMVADATMACKPTILYPYHYGDTNCQELVDLLKDIKQTEIRIRTMH
jgi:L-ascorbate metabolism protein UlaG (beta-lactamase superfamily)